MADIIDTYIKKIDGFKIDKKVNYYLLLLKKKRDWIIKFFMIKIELLKIKFELHKVYVKLGKFISKNYNDENVIDFSYKQDFLF